MLSLTNSIRKNQLGGDNMDEREKVVVKDVESELACQNGCQRADGSPDGG